MLQKEFNSTILFLSVCQFLAVFAALLLIWAKGTTIPEQFVSRAAPVFLVSAIVGLVGGVREFLVAYRRGDLALKAKAIGLLLAVIVLFDVWLSQGIVKARDIATLILSGLAVVPVHGVQIASILEKQKERK